MWLHAGGKVKSARGPFQRKSRHASKGDEAREILANVILCHVPVLRFNFQAKVCYITLQGPPPASLSASPLGVQQLQTLWTLQLSAATLSVSKHNNRNLLH